MEFFGLHYIALFSGSGMPQDIIIRPKFYLAFVYSNQEIHDWWGHPGFRVGPTF